MNSVKSLATNCGPLSEMIPLANGDALKAYGDGRESAPQDDYPPPPPKPGCVCVTAASVTSAKLQIFLMSILRLLCVGSG
jgi:hypothetical protein